MLRGGAATCQRPPLRRDPEGDGEADAEAEGVLEADGDELDETKPEALALGDPLAAPLRVGVPEPPEIGGVLEPVPEPTLGSTSNALLRT